MAATPCRIDSIIHHDSIDPNTLGRMASQAGMEPSDMAALVATVEDGFREVMAETIEGYSIDTEAFGAFIEADPLRANMMMEAAREMVMTNDMSGIEDLASSFYEQADSFMPDETRAALTEAGFDYQDTAEGLKVLINGVPVSFSVAVKQQIVRFI